MQNGGRDARLSPSFTELIDPSEKLILFSKKFLLTCYSLINKENEKSEISYDVCFLHNPYMSC
jgi:hypothetical protein